MSRMNALKPGDKVELTAEQQGVLDSLVRRLMVGRTAFIEAAKLPSDAKFELWTGIRQMRPDLEAYELVVDDESNLRVGGNWEKKPQT